MVSVFEEGYSSPSSTKRFPFPDCALVSRLYGTAPIKKLGSCSDKHHANMPAQVDLP